METQQKQEQKHQTIEVTQEKQKQKEKESELKHRERFVSTARHIEGTDMCMITLPCKYTDKKVMFLVEEMDE
jgi:hypothetical protein